MIRLTSLLLAASISSFGAVDSGLLTLLPSDTQTVAYLDAQSSRSSGFGQFLLRQMGSHEQAFQDMIQKTGFDPRRDLQTLVIASLPPDSRGQNRVVVLARGIFNPSLISDQAKAKGMVPKSFEGATMLVSTSGNPTALTFPETGLVAFGDRAGIEQLLSNRANPSTLSPGLQAQITAASRENDAWFASTVPGNKLVSHVPQGTLGNSTQNSQVMQAVLQSNGGVHFGNNIQLTFNAQTRSDKDATALTDFIRFMSSTIQMQRQNDPRAALLASSIDTMQLGADGNQVHTSLEIPEADLEQVLASQARSSRHSR